MSSGAPYSEQHPNDPPRSCGAVVVRSKEDLWEALLIRSKRGNWSFPKGRMDPGESEIDTAIREIREETGIIVSIDARFRREVPAIPVDKPGFRNDRLIVFYLAKAIGGEDTPQLSEIRELKWVPFCKESAALIDFLPDREVFLDAIAAFNDLG
jgi:8-oxo-dGTP pyrophosphatase MutT (NUDIX family)